MRSPIMSLTCLSTCLCLAVLSVAAPALGAQATDAITGLWYDTKREGAVAISKCGSVYCGRIVWLKSPNQKNGKPLMDARNTAKAKRTRPICGLKVLGGLKPVAGSKLSDGWVYSPRRGKRFSARVTLANKNTLKVRGFVSLVALGKTETWTRAPDNLKRCETPKS